MIEVTLVSMGPLAEWGPGQIAPVAPPLGGPDYNMTNRGKNFMAYISKAYFVLKYEKEPIETFTCSV